MLVLSRRVGEKILVGKDITITVTRIKSSQVRIGVDAPAELAIVREEVALREEGEDAPEPKRRSAPRRDY